MVDAALEDRLHAGELWSRLAGLEEGQALAVVRVAREFQSWALVERLYDESAAEASSERAAFLARLAREIAEDSLSAEADPYRNP
jgi:hypothetical protein